MNKKLDLLIKQAMPLLLKHYKLDTLIQSIIMRPGHFWTKQMGKILNEELLKENEELQTLLEAEGIHTTAKMGVYIANRWHAQLRETLLSFTGSYILLEAKNAEAALLKPFCPPGDE